jgi:antitoxin VapB
LTYRKKEELRNPGGAIMALNIKNAEAEQLARELARRRKQGITEVVTEALRKEVERERRKPRREDAEEFQRHIQDIVDHFNRLPHLDDRSDEELLGYNDRGHFD